MKKFSLVLTMLAFFLSSIFTSCWSTGTARETIPKTAVTLQRVRSTVLQDIPMQIFVDDVSYELLNAATTTIIVNNGEHIVYAVLGDAESKTIRFTAKSQSITINVSPNYKLISFPPASPIELTIVVK